MPTLTNPRRERLAQLLASGKTATEAHELAGYTPNSGNASNMARSTEIKTRVMEINEATFERERKVAARVQELTSEALEQERTVAIEHAAVTKASLINDLREARKGALEAGQYSAFVNATKEIAILAGIRVERSERGAPHEFDWVERLSTEELKALAKGELDVDSLRPSRTVN